MGKEIINAQNQGSVQRNSDKSIKHIHTGKELTQCKLSKNSISNKKDLEKLVHLIVKGCSTVLDSARRHR